MIQIDKLFESKTANENSTSLDFKDYWNGTTKLDLGKLINLKEYWSLGFQAAILELARKLEEEHKKNAESLKLKEKTIQDAENKKYANFVKLKDKAIQLATIGASIEKMDTLFKGKIGEMYSIEWEYFSPIDSLKIVSYQTLLLGEIYYRHLCLFDRVHTQDDELDHWLQREKRKSNAAYKATVLKGMLIKYRQENQLPSVNYDEIFKVKKDEVKQEQELSHEEPSIEDAEDYQFADVSARRVPEIEKELNLLLSGLEWPAAFLTSLNKVCAKAFDLDVSRFQLIKRAGSENSCIPNLTFEASKIIAELFAIQKGYWNRKEKVSQLRKKLIDKKENFNDRKETLLETRSRKLEQQFKLEQEKRLEREKLENSREAVSPNAGTPQSQLGNSSAQLALQTGTSTNSQINVSQNVSANASSNVSPNNTVRTQEGLPVANLPAANLTPNPNNSVTPTSPQASPFIEAQRRYQQFLASTRAQQKSLDMQDVNETLQSWPETVRKEYQALLQQERQGPHGQDLKYLFDKFQNNLKTDLKIIEEEEHILTKHTHLVEFITDLYWEVVNHDQLIFLLQQNPRSKEKCNRYFEVLLNLQDTLKISSIVLKDFPEEAERFNTFAQKIQDELLRISKLLIEYHLLNETSPFRTPYRPRFQIESETVYFLWNMSPSKGKIKSKWPDLIPQVFIEPLANLAKSYLNGSSLGGYMATIQAHQASSSLQKEGVTPQKSLIFSISPQLNQSSGQNENRPALKIDIPSSDSRSSLNYFSLGSTSGNLDRSNPGSNTSGVKAESKVSSTQNTAGNNPSNAGGHNTSGNVSGNQTSGTQNRKTPPVDNSPSSANSDSLTGSLLSTFSSITGLFSRGTSPK